MVTIHFLELQISVTFTTCHIFNSIITIYNLFSDVSLSYISFWLKLLFKITFDLFYDKLYHQHILKSLKLSKMWFMNIIL